MSILDNICKWKIHDKTEMDYYETSCGHTFCLNNDYSLKENEIKYCPFCGKEIIETDKNGTFVIGATIYKNLQTHFPKVSNTKSKLFVDKSQKEK